MQNHNLVVDGLLHDTFSTESLQNESNVNAHTNKADTDKAIENDKYPWLEKADKR